MARRKPTRRPAKRKPTLPHVLAKKTASEPAAPPPPPPRPKLRIDRQPLTRHALGIADSASGLFQQRLPPPPWGDALHAAVLRGLMDFGDFETLVLQHYRVSYEIDHADRAINISLLQLAAPQPTMARLADHQINKLTLLLEEYVGKERWYFLFCRILKAAGWNTDLVPSDIDRRELESRLQHAQRATLVPVIMPAAPQATGHDTERHLADPVDRAAASDLRAVMAAEARADALNQIAEMESPFSDGIETPKAAEPASDSGKAQEQLRDQRAGRKRPINPPLR